MAASAARAGLSPRDPNLDIDKSAAASRRRPLEAIFASGPPVTPHSGTKALMLAVLEDGIRCYLSNKKKLQREAETWMYCSRRLVFSFNVLCETFGLDPNATRQALRKMRHEASGISSLRHRGRQNVRHNVISLA